MKKQGEDAIYKKMQDMLESHPERFQVMEKQVELEVQLEYFDMSKEVKNELEPEVVLDLSNEIADSNASYDLKKKRICQLASVEDVRAYRLLEKYEKNIDEELEVWMMLALQESRMLLESSLLDEQKIFISTGLGGKNDKLRYFVVFLSNSNTGFSKLEKEIMVKEVNYRFEKYNAELEECNIHNGYFMFSCLIPLNVDLTELFNDALEEINELGSFVHEHFIVTNVKKLSVPEVDDFIEQQDDAELNDKK